MPVTIARESPDSADAVALIGELERYISPMYPHDDEHGLSPAQLVRAGVAFFVGRVDGAPAGCGGVVLDVVGAGEIVRMYVRPRYRGQGLGRLMLEHLENYAREHGARALRLKTGVYQLEALGLYQKHGYREVRAFGPYRDHPLNRYYEKQL